ncbi:MAG: hypothetical protein AB7O49_02845 [Sphingomonadales bacterium]
MDDDFSLAEHPELLLLPVGYVLFFVAMWLMATTVLAFASGWFRLARTYPDRPEETPLLSLKRQTGLLGPGISYRGVLRLEVCPSGLRVGVAWLLGPFCKDFLVPWSDISPSREKTLFWSSARLEFGAPRVGVLKMRPRLAEALEHAADGLWPLPLTSAPR